MPVAVFVDLMLTGAYCSDDACHCVAEQTSDADAASGRRDSEEVRGPPLRPTLSSTHKGHTERYVFLFSSSSIHSLGN